MKFVPNLNASLSREAYEGWKSFADAHGLTVAALLEALGLQMVAGADTPDEGLCPEGQAAIAVARRIAAQRRRRSPA